MEVVAVRWSCFACEATVVGAPETFPAGWFELEAPVWRSQHAPRHYCVDHAEEGRDLQRRRRARYEGRIHMVSAEEYERVRNAVHTAVKMLDQLKLSGERATDREVSKQPGPVARSPLS